MNFRWTAFLTCLAATLATVACGSSRGSRPPDPVHSTRIAQGHWLSGTESSTYYWLFGSDDAWSDLQDATAQGFTNRGWTVHVADDEKSLEAFWVEAPDASTCFGYSDFSKRRARDSDVRRIIGESASTRAGEFTSSALVIGSSCDS